MSDNDQTTIDNIVKGARDAAAGDGTQNLHTAVENASPDERSAAAQALADDVPALEALHQALQDLDIVEERQLPGADSP